MTLLQKPAAAATTTSVGKSGKSVGKPVRTQPRSRGSALSYVPLVVLALTFALPLLFMVASSFKPREQILGDLTSWRAFVPVGDLSMTNYVDVFDRVPVGRFFVNSLFVTVTIVVLGLLVNSMAGFALSRLRFRGKSFLFAGIIATLIVPFETFAIPMVYLVSKLPRVALYSDGFAFEQGWNNSYQVLIIPFIANAFSIFLFAQYYKSIPKSLDEAAMIDGAGWWRIYRSVISPLAGPAFATSAILTFLPQWNSYLWPLLVIQDEELRPVQVGMRYFFATGTAEGTPWGQIMAYTTMITIPVVVVFLCFQRSFVSSVASAGVKG
jgi:multiple sugar transport system permease protein